MAWTTPRTWTDGELVTKAIMDAHIRDNFLAVGPHLIARKTADQTVTSSTTLVDATTLAMTIAANEVWLFDFNIVFSASATGDLKTAFTFPAGGRIDASVSWWNVSAAANVGSWSGTTTPTTSQSFAGNGATVRYLMPIKGIFTNAGTAGNLQFQFAQDTSDGTATTIYAQSTVWGVKLA